MFYYISSQENSGIQTEMKDTVLRLAYDVWICSTGSYVSPKTSPGDELPKMHSLSALSVTTWKLSSHTWTHQSRIKIDCRAVAHVYILCPNLRLQSIHSAGDRAPWREQAVTRTTGPVKLPYHPASAREGGGGLRTQLYLQRALMSGHEFKMEIY